MKNVFLLVDDEPMLLEVVSFAIQDEGYNTVEASSVDEAIQILSTQKIDAIISDVRMPKQTGLDLLKFVKEHYKSVPFTFMSGYSELDDATAKKMGAKGLIPKPLDFANLRNTLKLALSTAT